jgi:hypothetical protein
VKVSCMSIPTNRTSSGLTEWLWVVVVTAIVLLLSSIPYWVGYRAQTDEFVFSGAVFDRLDVDVHLASMQRGAQGSWAYQMRFTSEPHPGVYSKLVYIILGQAARILGMDIPAAYQLFRLLFGFTAGLSIYFLISQAFAEIFWRRVAYVAATMGSGVGWLLLLIGWLPQVDISPIDFWLIDPYPFFGMLVLPHFSLVTTLLAAVLAGFLDYLRKPAFWKIALIALGGVSVQFAQSFTPILADFGIAGAALFEISRIRKVNWRVVGALFLIALAQLPLLVYGVGKFWLDPFWESFLSQNITLSPPPGYYVLGFGLFWPPALWGIWCIIRNMLINDAEDKPPAHFAALVWLVGALILAYLPWNLQRRFTHALMVPLALLAVVGLRDLSQRWIAHRVRLLALLIVAFSAISSFYLAFGLSLYVANRPADLFDPSTLVEAVDWLGAQASPDDVVLSAPRSGQLLAARGGLIAYIGHPIETLHFNRKSDLVQEFYSGHIPMDALTACGCDWLIYGPYEKAISSQFEPLNSDLVYQNTAVTVYKINQP